METSIEHFNEFNKRLRKYSNKELIQAFNEQVGINAWGTARAAYLAAIHKEFDNRNFDYSSIGDKSSLSFKCKIEIKDNKIVKDE